MSKAKIYENLVKMIENDFHYYEAEWYPPAFMPDARRMYIKWALNNIPVIAERHGVDLYKNKYGYDKK